MAGLRTQNKESSSKEHSDSGHNSMSKATQTASAEQSGERHIVDACCQTDFVVIDVNLAELKERIASGTCDNVKETLTASSIKETAQSALNKTGWVYDPATRTYFDYSSNLYYYPETRLYYNYKNGSYYRYNQETRTYEFHYQLENFKDSSKNAERQSRDVMNVQKRTIEVKRHTLPNLKRVGIELTRKVKDHIEVDQRMDITESMSDEGDFVSPCKIRKVSQSIKENELSRLHESIFKGYYSDSETQRSRKKYKYYRCHVCRELILPTCCRQNTKEKVIKNTYESDSEIKTMTCFNTKYTNCLDCHALSSSNCCIKEYFWCDPVHVKGKRHSKSSKRQRGKQSRRVIHVSSSSGTDDEETLPETTQSYSVEGNRVNYSTDVQSNFRPDMVADTSMIPCIRAMVTSSQSIDVGTLFMITCTGATIGSDNSCDIQIEETDVAGQHASIGYNQQQRNYFVTDLGSGWGTTLNSTTENNAGVKTVLQIPITHKSILIIGSSILILHLHLGYETCDDCEPGQVKALMEKSHPTHTRQAMSNPSVGKLRMTELRNLKKKYNLHRSEKLPVNPKYADRADQRRRTVGSDNPYEKDEMPTSYDTEIADSNKGHQMLRKMGWNKGSGLGKSQTGMKEPITPKGSEGKHGLGFGGS